MTSWTIGDVIVTAIILATEHHDVAFGQHHTRAAFLSRYRDDTLVIGTHWGGPGAGRVRVDNEGRFSVETAGQPG